METAIWLNRQSNLQLVIRSQEQNFSLISSQLKKKYPSAPMWHVIFLQDEWTFSIFFPPPWSKIRSAETNQSCHGLGKELGFRFNFSPSCFYCQPSPLVSFARPTVGAFNNLSRDAQRDHVTNWMADWRWIWKSNILITQKAKRQISWKIAKWTPAATIDEWEPPPQKTKSRGESRRS